MVTSEGLVTDPTVLVRAREAPPNPVILIKFLLSMQFISSLNLTNKSCYTLQEIKNRKTIIYFFFPVKDKKLSLQDSISNA
jgi:hypothetical protein